MKMEIQHGIVAYVDILGYQNLIDNNELIEIGEIIQKILKIGDDVTESLKEKIIELFQLSENESWKNIFPNDITNFIRNQVISDSIVFTGEFSDEMKNNMRVKVIHLMLFVLAMQELCKLSFKNGIVLRGAIDYGEYIFKDKIFASKAIITAYRTSELLDFSGIVLCDNFGSNFFKDDIEPAIQSIIDIFTSEVNCPIRSTGATEKKLRVIDWTDALEESDKINLRQYLFNSFSMHNKDINQSVIRKITNTENVLRTIMAKKDED